VLSGESFVLKDARDLPATLAAVAELRRSAQRRSGTGAGRLAPAGGPFESRFATRPGMRV
jgi:hypothetical protein